MTKRIIIQDDEPEELQRSRFHKSVQIADTVQHIAPEKLKINPLNKELFAVQDGKEYEALKDDVLQRGIIVPLIAKSDNTLLAGHTRLRIAKELRLKSVPVQYAKEMNATEERKFLVNDNLLRRHLTNVERLNLYRFLYPNFDATFIDEETRVAQGRVKQGSERLTIQKIAGETFQNYESVKKHIQRGKADIQQAKARQEKGTNQKRDSVPFLEEAHENVLSAQKLIDRLRTKAQTMTAKERKELRGLLESLLKSL
jgi:ParB-like chromosome segregation protein Spo0J